MLGSFAVAPDGSLRPIGVAPVDGEEACHLCVDPSGRAVVSAHYSSASFAVSPVRPSGDVDAPSHLLKVRGSGPHVGQSVPHPHMVQVTPDGRWIVSADLGTDEVATYRLDAASGRLAAQQIPAAKVQAGGGPRHFVFHPDGRVFVCNELDSSVTTMRYDPSAGTLAYVSHISTLIDPNRRGEAQCGAIRLSPDLRFLYVGNRLRETIAVFAVEAGGLTPIGETPAPGKSARDMWVADNVVYVAFARADKLEVRERDAANGAIGPVVQTIDLPVPMFVLPI
jgi:6-phosphogluconolactonase